MIDELNAQINHLTTENQNFKDVIIFNFFRINIYII